MKSCDHKGIDGFQITPPPNHYMRIEGGSDSRHPYDALLRSYVTF
jgi:hypothetical protein